MAVDLPDGQTLFVLLRSESNVEWASYVYVYLRPRRGQSIAEAVNDVPNMTCECTLPRMWPATAIQPSRSAYPMMVTFGDLNDPTSVALVDPDDLAASFGEGINISRITAELTDDPVTTGIEERLEWLGMSFRGFDSSDFPEGLPLGDINGLFQKGQNR